MMSPHFLSGNVFHSTWTGEIALLRGQRDTVPVRLSDWYRETRLSPPTYQRLLIGQKTGLNEREVSGAVYAKQLSESPSMSGVPVQAH